MLFATDAERRFLSGSATILKTLQTDLKKINPKANLPIRVALYKSGLSSWNHSKIIAVDDAEVIVGGENLWTPDYLGPDPMFDLSMRVKGGAATASRLYVDFLWKQRISEANSGAAKAPFPVSNLTEGSIPMLGVGRLFDGTSDASDAAMNATIKLAKKSILILQQDLYSNIVNRENPAPSFVMESLFQAIDKNVSLTIIKSNEGDKGNYGMLSPELTYAMMYKAYIGSRSKSNPSAADQFCKNVHFAPLALEGVRRWPSGVALRTHTKFFMVDDAAYYIGSQNFYPSNLQEFGLIIFSEDSASKVKMQYWDKFWEQSKALEFSCKNIPK